MNAGAHVVLVGAGHAHLHVAARASELQARGARVTLIDPGEFWYSGRATAMLSGRFSAADDRIDPQAVIEPVGGRLLRTRAIGIDRSARQVALADGSTQPYDWLSFNVGSVIDDRSLPFASDAQDVWPVKPIAGLWDLRRRLESGFAAGERPAMAVIGGGATGCEMAANLAALARRSQAPITIHLVHGKTRLAPALPRAASERLRRRLGAVGVELHLNSRVTGRTVGQLMLDSGRAITADVVVLATGLRAPPWLAELGLPFDEGLCVDATLRSRADARVFATGDCADLAGHALPRLGVFGVRQAPILHANLLASLSGATLQTYRPQSRWLSILELGDGTALAARGRLWWHGRASRWLKHRLDSRFLALYQGAG